MHLQSSWQLRLMVLPSQQWWSIDRFESDGFFSQAQSTALVAQWNVHRASETLNFVECCKCLPLALPDVLHSHRKQSTESMAFRRLSPGESCFAWQFMHVIHLLLSFMPCPDHQILIPVHFSCSSCLLSRQQRRTGTVCYAKQTSLDNLQHLPCWEGCWHHPHRSKLSCAVCFWSWKCGRRWRLPMSSFCRTRR